MFFQYLVHMMLTVNHIKNRKYPLKRLLEGYMPLQHMCVDQEY